jgi:NADH-quinone oxidoreductase subunit N
VNLGALLAQLDSAAVPSPSVDWPALVPLMIMAAGGLVLLTINSVVIHLPRWFATAWTIAVGIASGVCVIPVWVRVNDVERGPTSTLSNMLGVDGFYLFFVAIISAAVVLTALLAHDYLRREDLEGVEFYVLMMLSASGGMVMAGANDLLVMFLGLEALSIAAYVMAAMHLRRFQSQEAGMKYFVLGAFSSAFLLYGIAMVYGATGSTNLVDIKRFLASNILLVNGELHDGMLLIGMALMLVGLGFKIAAVPFHSWSPDVYQGAPTPSVAFMAAAVKAASFAALLRVFVVGFELYSDDWQPAIYALAVVTLLVGSTIAVVQTDVKRMLAYSSISHAGFILVGAQAASARGTASCLFYLAAYTFMVIGSFGVVTLVGSTGDSRHSLSDYRGLSSRRPVLAFAFTLLLLAQAGVPFTTGFFAKFYVIRAATEAHSYWLAIVAMVSSVIAAFLYLRIVLAMYASDADADDTAPIAIPTLAGIAILIAVGVTVVFGFVPSVLEQWARDAVPAILAASTG